MQALCYNEFMDFNFNIAWVFIGLLVAAAGGAVVYWHQPIANNLANGVRSYDHVKLFGVIAIVVGLLIAANLHTLILTIIVNIIRGGN